MHFSSPQKCIAALALLLGLSGCDSSGSSITEPLQRGAASNAQLREILALMEENAVWREQIDWAELRDSVYAVSRGGFRPEGLRAGVEVALRLLGDNLSSYTPVGRETIWAPQISCPLPGFIPIGPGGPPPAPALPANVGYFMLDPYFSSADASAYVARMHERIRVSDREGLLGWIVDLRFATSYEIWPLLAAVGPFLEPEVAGYFVGPGSHVSPWRYADGTAWQGETARLQVAAPYHLIAENPRIAVLTDWMTMNAAEAIAISFRGQAETRSFGLRTCGLSIGRSPYELRDGSWLTLANSVMADRTGRLYGQRVMPDEENYLGGTGEAMFSRVIEWLNTGE